MMSKGTASHAPRDARSRDADSVQAITCPRRGIAPAEGRPRARRDLTAIFACQECHTPREPNGMHLDRARLFAGGIPFEGPWGLVHSANVSIPAGLFPDRVLEDAIRGRLAWKFQMPTDLYRGIGRRRHARHRGIHQDAASSVHSRVHLR